MRAADLLVRSLAVAGVRRLFTLSGNQIMPVFDACIDEGLELIHTRHEAAAVHMADAWGRLTGEPGIALVTAGPGFANTLSALYVALMAESPMVLISGASPLRRAGQAAFQEMPQAEMAGHVTKASWQIDDPERIGHDVARAWRTALSGRPGPVHVSIPGDVLETTLKYPQHALPSPDDFRPLETLLDAIPASRILNRLREAERPLILTGPTLCRGCGPEELRGFRVSPQVPVVSITSPRGLKDPVLGRFRELLPQADVVLLLGQPLNFSLGFGGSPPFAEDCRFLVVDPELRMLDLARRNLGDNSRLEIAEIADALPAIDRILSWLPDEFPYPDPTWRLQVEAAVEFRSAEWQTLASPSEGAIHPAEICRAIEPFLGASEIQPKELVSAWVPGNAVFISDGGEFGQWAQACLSARHRIINGPSGAIGGGIPFALAARLAFPESRIVTTVGDGTFGFHPLEFETAVRHSLPFVCVVGNDARWNAEHQIQLRDYGPERTIGCELLPARYDEVVRSLGGHGEYVTRPAELESALRRAFDSGKPACVNVMIDGVAAPE
jgi:thiamine pyrophosphate-dependent acetolactate synthase large subunit-like protein